MYIINNVTRKKFQNKLANKNISSDKNDKEKEGIQNTQKISLINNIYRNNQHSQKESKLIELNNSSDNQKPKNRFLYRFEKNKIFKNEEFNNKTTMNYLENLIRNQMPNISSNFDMKKNNSKIKIRKSPEDSNKKRGKKKFFEIKNKELLSFNNEKTIQVPIIKNTKDINNNELSKKINDFNSLSEKIGRAHVWTPVT